MIKFCIAPRDKPTHLLLNPGLFATGVLTFDTEAEAQAWIDTVPARLGFDATDYAIEQHTEDEIVRLFAAHEKWSEGQV